MIAVEGINEIDSILISDSAADQDKSYRMETVLFYLIKSFLNKPTSKYIFPVKNVRFLELIVVVLSGLSLFAF